MKITFRTDASIDIGTGHVMRCLTLANALRELGHQCVFISREHSGNLCSLIEGEGFKVHRLPLEKKSPDTNLLHSSWLGGSQTHDAELCQCIIAEFSPDWIVVDHYALDFNWEIAVSREGCRLLVIDDLADRKHKCDILLDQNLGKTTRHYELLVPHGCITLTGPTNALLRPEFSSFRTDSLTRRRQGTLREVMITLGGVDAENFTDKILEALARCALPDDIKFTVVLGVMAPHFESLTERVGSYPWPVSVLRGIKNMAQRMMAADLIIGAGGGTSWERCCLGVPSLLVVLADNQKFAVSSLCESGAAKFIDLTLPLESQLQAAFDSMLQGDQLKVMSQSASMICEGRGVDRLIETMLAVAKS
ncbi:UDP-2,4-diacetamido-2,4,6-trideoxy-beta-L-altropyranose hydrolase [Pseudomonas monteilii]|uniref:UDP-2,4-diacetamido-2,4, 6-trideoxy-beta-L-altropyranose hydrolase n=1 Tax=Pseudomonas monteilii TaxID=76759 RepID=UPI0018AAE223|nr:UDP-2,4-diacetamido-2,4,6-trideoxy-beta-L-altropyranose hydrolase [Pseudomonas monteilii]MBF8748651.1 UDP-2,4-diacetamido-2,4,6-trideoxy-beta-L-altropyranose hydrolase [Pseudomonas monteilii]